MLFNRMLWVAYADHLLEPVWSGVSTDSETLYGRDYNIDDLFGVVVDEPETARNSLVESKHEQQPGCM